MDLMKSNENSLDFDEISLARRKHPPPINMAMMENIFSAFVFAETFPKPTLVRLVQVKNSAEM